MNAITRLGSFTITPLQPTIGAEIGGLDLRAPITDEVRDALKQALLRHKVLFFRDQIIDTHQQAAFANRFGPLYTHPSTHRSPAIPSAHAISAEEFKTYAADYDTQRQGWDAYHTDTSWRLVPTWGAVLRAVNLPEQGGDTIWVDGARALETLPEDARARLEGLHVTHDFGSSLKRAGHEYPIVAHPAIRTHRETGQKILWVNFSLRPTLIGLDIAESRALLTIVSDQYRRPENQVRFSWRPGSLAFWDNRAAVHYAVRDYGDFPRLLERILIADEPLYADL